MLRTIALDSLSEGEFLHDVLEHLRTAQQQPYCRLTDAQLEAIEEERIGEHFSQYPFLY